MKNYLLLLLLLTTTWLSAQDDLPSRRFKGGVIVGLNLSQIDGDFLAGYNKPGINAGLTAIAILTERWEVGIELMYSQKGASRTLTDGFANLPNLSSPLDKIRLNYVEAPILVHFHDWKFRVSSGFSYARLLNFEIIDFEGEEPIGPEKIRSGSFTFIIGADYFFKENWSIGVRWSRESDILVKEVDGDFRGRSVSIRSNYLF